MKLAAVLAIFAAISASATLGAQVVDLSTFPPDSVWRCANSSIASSKDPDGTTVWRWTLPSGGEGFLWLSESLPVHKDLPRYQRLIYDVNFAEGQINQFWPRAMGVLPPPFEKMFCEWNLFYFTHPHQQWITYQQVLNDPSWFAHWASQIPQDIQMDRARFLGFACLPKSQSCVVELRHVRLVRDVIRVEKPYLTTPIGWPVKGRTPYFVNNVSDAPAAVSAVVTSQHRWFSIAVDPPHATIAPGETKRFDVVVTGGEGAAPMTEETAVVEFVPNGDASLAYRTETFCTAPLPKSVRRRVVNVDPNAGVDADANFWMSVDLAGQSEIPHGVGHMLVAGMPITCPKCKQGHLAVDPQKWLRAKCDRCGYTEDHTRSADALWIATWSEIHGGGPNPVALGRAYLATGDEKYATKAIELLTLLASGYGKLPWHNPMWPASDGGWDHVEPASPDAVTNGASARWGNTPTYGTNFMVMGLATLHNMIADSPSWTDAQRKLVHEGLWIPVATELAKITPGISNMNDIINRDLILAGFATADANMIYRGTLYPTGLVGRMRDISPDGYSDEGSALNYHLAAMREWLPSIGLLTNSGLPFAGITDRAVAALKMPLARASLNGLAYCTGNSGAAWFNVPLDHDQFALADRTLPADLWARDRHYLTEPTLFRDAGWAILRSGDTVDTQVMVNLDFGRSHGHGDLDRMNLGVLAFGVPLSADPGSSYNYNTDAARGLAEESMNNPFVANTVIVDGQDQLRGAGELLEWKPDDRANQRVAAQISSIYPGVTWRRNVALADGIVVVIDDLKSDKPHRYESAWHHYGQATPGDGCALSDLSQPLGDAPYRELLNPHRITGEPIIMDWSYKDVHVRAWQPVEPGQLAYTAQTGACWDNTRGLPVDGLFTRRDGKTARFITVLEPYKSAPRVKSVIATAHGVRLTFAAGGERGIEF